MALNTPYSPGDTIESAKTNQDLNGLADGTNDVDNNNLVLFRQESFDNYFADGGVWSISSGLVGTMDAGVMYFAGNRTPFSGVGSYTFNGTSDTYVDIDDGGVVHYTPVPNNDTPPDLAPNAIRNAVIVTDDSFITDIIQQDRDVSGNLIYNTKPVAQSSGAPRVKLIASASTITPDASNTDILAITALAQSTTIALPTGTPANGQGLMIRIKDNGTARSISWNSVYRPIGFTLPTATAASKTDYIGMRYNSQDNRWDVVGVARE